MKNATEVYWTKEKYRTLNDKCIHVEQTHSNEVEAFGGWSNDRYEVNAYAGKSFRFPSEVSSLFRSIISGQTIPWTNNLSST